MSFVYKTMKSPIGLLTLVASDKGLAGILWEHDNPERVRLTPRTEDTSNPVLLETEKQLNEYFAGKRRSFSVTLDYVGTPFQKKVWKSMLAIPFGETRSYGQLAKEIGMEALYDTVYRQLSGNAAHPSVASSERHIMRGIDGSVENLIFKPQRNGVEQALSVALFAFLSALEALGVIFKRADINTTVELYNIRHQALSNEFSSKASQ